MCGVAAVQVLLRYITTCTVTPGAQVVYATLHVLLLVVLGILGQCSPVYPYVELSGWYTVLAIGIHILVLPGGSACTLLWCRASVCITVCAAVRMYK